VIIAGGAAAIAKWSHAWWWLVVVTAAAAAVAPPALAALSQGSQRRQETGRRGPDCKGPPARADASFPLLGPPTWRHEFTRTSCPFPTSTGTKKTPSELICAPGARLLIGSSMVAKTRMAAGVIAEEFGSWPVAIPDSKTTLADLE